MNIQVFEITVPQFILTLNALNNILDKAIKYAEDKKVQPSILTNLRLAPDMFPFYKQIQIATDSAKGCVARLTGINSPVFEDKEQNLNELKERIQMTLNYLEGIKPEQFNGYETKKIELPWVPGKYLSGNDYLVQHALPNFYFHATTAYALLRSNGLDLSKGDFLGKQNWKNK
ncbi:MAG: DUF1993 family protein [Pseudobdellovibrio sp.]